MKYKEKEKIANEYLQITKRLLEKNSRENLRPDYFDFLVDRIIGFFPVDGVEISLMLKDKLNNELNFNL